MSRTQTIDFQGVKIFYIDFSNLKSPAEIALVMQDAKNYIHKRPANSVLTLTSVEGTHFNNEIRDMFTALIKANKPFVKASAVIGVSGLKQIVFNSIVKITGRETRAFDTEEQAKTWLVRTLS